MKKRNTTRASETKSTKTRFYVSTVYNFAGGLTWVEELVASAGKLKLAE
jgi:hypothetical protein